MGLPKIDLPPPPIVEPRLSTAPEGALPKIDLLPPLDVGGSAPRPRLVEPAVVTPPTPQPLVVAPSSPPERSKPIGPPPEVHARVPSVPFQHSAEAEEAATHKTVILSTDALAAGDLAPQHTQAVALEEIGLAPVPVAEASGAPSPPSVIVDDSAFDDVDRKQPIISDDTPIVMEPAPVLDLAPQERPVSASGVISDDTPIVMEPAAILDSPVIASLERPQTSAGVVSDHAIIDVPPTISDDTPIVMQTSELVLEGEGAESTFAQIKSSDRDRLRALAARAMAAQSPSPAPAATTTTPAAATGDVEEQAALRPPESPSPQADPPPPRGKSS
jgi:hypothetical protein